MAPYAHMDDCESPQRRRPVHVLLCGTICAGVLILLCQVAPGRWFRTFASNTQPITYSAMQQLDIVNLASMARARPLLVQPLVATQRRHLRSLQEPFTVAQRPHLASRKSFVTSHTLRNLAPAATMFEELSANMLQSFRKSIEEIPLVQIFQDAQVAEYKGAARHVIMVDTEEELNRQLNESPHCALLKFTAEACGPCKLSAPKYEKIAGEYSGKAKLLKMDAAKNLEVAKRFKVSALPSFYLLRGGEIVAMETGFYRDKTERTLRSLLDDCTSFA